VGVAVAQRQLRHSDASTTLGHYGHILGDDHREAVEAIESALSLDQFCAHSAAPVDLLGHPP